uniref:Transposase Tc1-like domain-containing protein n=1 Tax=Cyprinus carpio TaxID=7962 RepID=A0A8C1RY83_CYPCA
PKARRVIAFLTLANVNVHESTIRRTLANHSVHGASNKNIAASLQFAKDHEDIPKGYWRNVLWTNETKTELLVQMRTHGV